MVNYVLYLFTAEILVISRHVATSVPKRSFPIHRVLAFEWTHDHTDIINMGLDLKMLGIFPMK